MPSLPNELLNGHSENPGCTPRPRMRLKVEMQLADTPRDANAFLGAVAAFAGQLGLEPEFRAGALAFLFLGRNCELRLTDLDAVADAMATRWDPEDERDMELRAAAATWDAQFDPMESARLDRRLVNLEDESAATRCTLCDEAMERACLDDTYRRCSKCMEKAEASTDAQRLRRSGYARKPKGE